MQITMVKKRSPDGEECAKCAQATAELRNRGLWDRISEVVWAVEGDPASAGNELGTRYGVDRAPFFIVREDGAEKDEVFTSVLRLIRERLGGNVAAPEQPRRIDPDDIGI
jgi:hypothetical protein